MQNLYLFFIASLMLNLTPGNDMLYVISRSISQGFKGGLFSALGIFIGCLIHVFAAVLGISFIIAKSAFLFQAIKFAGAAYLIYLGINALIAKPSTNDAQKDLQKVNPYQLLKQGAITNALNPKVAIFFLSFLPQFINPTTHTAIQLFTLGIWFDVQGTLILICIAFLIGRTRNFIQQNPKFWAIQEKITGVILIGLGVKLVV